MLVDRDAQAKSVAENGPSNVIRDASEKGKPLTNEQIGDAVEKAFRSGLFTFTEIVFDKQHSHAVLAYSFYCGMLCGHGATVVLEKVDGKWKIWRKCGAWIS